METVKNLWVPAVNNTGQFGRWAVCEVTDPYQAMTMIRYCFARLLREDCDAPIKTHKEPEVDAHLRTLYLLGIDCILVAQKKAQKKLLDELKRTLNTWKNDQVLHEVFRAGSQPKIRLEWLEREISRLKTDLKCFKVAENYRAIEAEAQEKTKLLRQIEKQIAVLRYVWEDTMELLAKDYVVQTSTKAIQRGLLMTTDPGDLVLKPTCGFRHYRLRCRTIPPKALSNPTQPMT